MHASILVLGFLFPELPADAGVTYHEADQELEVSKSLHALVRKAQIETLQGRGFQVVDDTDRHTVKLHRPPETQTVEFARINVEHFWNLEDGYPLSESQVGIKVAGPYYAHLIDWEPGDREDSPVTAEKLQAVETFKAKIAAEFPGFAKAKVRMMNMFF